MKKILLLFMFVWGWEGTKAQPVPPELNVTISGGMFVLLICLVVYIFLKNKKNKTRGKPPFPLDASQYF